MKLQITVNKACIQQFFITDKVKGSYNTNKNATYNELCQGWGFGGGGGGRSKKIYRWTLRETGSWIQIRQHQW